MTRDEKTARELIVKIGKLMYQKNLVAASDGNISIRLPDGVIATPTGVSKGMLEEDALVKLDLDGNILAGGCPPSSEIKMHLAVYRRCRDLRSVVHAHPPVASVFAAEGRALDAAYLSEFVMTVGCVPVVPYSPPGSEELARAVAEFCQDYNAALLRHHGAVTWADDPMRAYFLMESLERFAQTAMYSKLLGFDQRLGEGQIDELMALRDAQGYGRGGRLKGSG
jgi:L-fuculose-phosphate aldolase